MDNKKNIENDITYTIKIDEFGTEMWYYHDKLHREVGPAIINDVDEYQAWYYQGEYIKVTSQSEFERWLKLQVFT